jgi:hypothetical protein
VGVSNPDESIPSSGNGSARDLLYRGVHPFAGRVGDRPILGRAGGDVGDRQCVPVFADRVAALVSDRVDLDRNGHDIFPAPGCGSSSATGQGARFGVRTAAQDVFLAFRRQPPIDDGRGRGRPAGDQCRNNVQIRTSVGALPRGRNTLGANAARNFVRAPSRYQPIETFGSSRILAVPAARAFSDEAAKNLHGIVDESTRRIDTPPRRRIL